jgi:predicted exporter
VTAAERWRIAAWLACVVASVVVITRTTFTTDISAFLPRSPTPAQQILVEQLREGVVSRLVLIGIEGAPPQDLAHASRQLAADLRRQESFASVDNGDGTGTAADREFLWRHRYLLSSAVTPQRFTAAALRERLEENLRLLQERSLLVCLTASPDALLKRAGSGSKRPLLKEGDRKTRIQELMELREGKYAEAHLSIDTTALTVDQVAEKIIEMAKLER